MGAKSAGSANQGGMGQTGDVQAFDMPATQPLPMMDQLTVASPMYGAQPMGTGFNPGAQPMVGNNYPALNPMGYGRPVDIPPWMQPAYQTAQVMPQPQPQPRPQNQPGVSPMDMLLARYLREQGQGQPRPQPQPRPMPPAPVQPQPARPTAPMLPAEVMYALRLAQMGSRAQPTVPPRPPVARPNPADLGWNPNRNRIS